MHNYLFLLSLRLEICIGNIKIKYLTFRLNTTITNVEEMKKEVEIKVTKVIKTLLPENQYFSIGSISLVTEEDMNYVLSSDDIFNTRVDNIVNGLYHFIYFDEVFNMYKLQNYTSPCYEIFNYFLNKNTYRMIYLLREIVNGDDHDLLNIGNMLHINKSNILTECYNLRLSNNSIDIESLLSVIKNHETDYFIILIPESCPLNVVESIAIGVVTNKRIHILYKSKNTIYKVDYEFGDIIFKKVKMR